MKTINKLIIAGYFCCISLSSTAQDAELSSHLSEAKSSYNSGDHESARFALQQSLVELDKIVGREILLKMPGQVSGMSANENDDNVSGSGFGYTGVYIHRDYGNPEAKNVNVEVITNSPMLGMVNSFLTNPLMMGMSGSDQKVVKIKSYKALVSKQDDGEGNVVGYDIQVPISDSMITFNCEGITNENEAVQIANQFDIPGIANLIKGN